MTLRDRHEQWLEWSVDRYGLLFFLVVVDYVSLLLIPDGGWGRFIAFLTVSVTALFAIDVSDVSRKVRITVRCMVAVLPILMLAYPLDPTLMRSLIYAGCGIVLATTPVLILMRILGHERVNMATMFAAIDVYVLIGLVFAMLYLASSHIPNQGPFFAQGRHQDRSNYVYFSYIVMTTVGFGDLTPATKLGKTLVVTEALLGQIFLVTAVARIVSLYGQSRGRSERPRRPGRGEPEPLDSGDVG